MDDFGTWLPCTDGRTHYLLKGAPLCGSPVRPTGGAAPTRATRGDVVAVTDQDCPDCDRLNVARWAALGARDGFAAATG